MNELQRRKLARRNESQSYGNSNYMLPSPGWLLPEEEVHNGADEGDHGVSGGCRDDGAGVEVAAVTQPGLMQNEADHRVETATLRNEPKEAGDTSLSRNEPSEVSLSEAAVLSNTRASLRNEPKVDRGVDADTGRREPASLRNEARPPSADDGNRIDRPAHFNFGGIMADAMRGLNLDLEMGLRKPSMRGSLSMTPGGSHGRAQSRRERRRKKAEARARAKAS